MDRKQKWQNFIIDLCWKIFLQSGKIGDYLLYYNLKQEKYYEHTGFINKMHCVKDS